MKLQGINLIWIWYCLEIRIAVYIFFIEVGIVAYVWTEYSLTEETKVVISIIQHWNPMVEFGLFFRSVFLFHWLSDNKFASIFLVKYFE